MYISFIDATHCDDATQCDTKNESISKKRPLRELCVLASHSVASSHSVAFKKDIFVYTEKNDIDKYSFIVNSFRFLLNGHAVTLGHAFEQSIPKKRPLRELWFLA